MALVGKVYEKHRKISFPMTDPWEWFVYQMVNFYVFHVSKYTTFPWETVMGLFLLFFNRLWDSESTIPGDTWFREIVGGILKKPAGFLAKNVRETKI